MIILSHTLNLEYYLNNMNWCCLPQTTNQNQNIYITPHYETVQQSKKLKFSFRTANTLRFDNSRVSQSSNQSQRSQELQNLERQYEILKEEQRVIDEFEKYRIGELQYEVSYFQRQLQYRTRQIQELRELFRLKLNERRLLVNQGYTMVPHKHGISAIDEISNSTQS